MENDTTTKPVVETPAVETKKGKVIRVTSTMTVDFPSLGWGIHEGEERDLPVEVASQNEILSKEFISIIK